MKKFAFLIPMLLLASCNQTIGWGSYSFHYCHIEMKSHESAHLLVTSWKEDDGGVELLTKNYGTILVGDGAYVLYDVKECPICGVEPTYR